MPAQPPRTGTLPCVFGRQQPGGRVNPFALQVLSEQGIATTGVRSKSWDEFATTGAPKMDLIITVCDSAANEICPVWPGHPATAHWGYADPSATTGSDARSWLPSGTHWRSCGGASKYSWRACRQAAGAEDRTDGAQSGRYLKRSSWDCSNATSASGSACALQSASGLGTGRPGGFSAHCVARIRPCQPGGGGVHLGDDLPDDDPDRLARREGRRSRRRA
jgi:hypothetical protein